MPRKIIIDTDPGIDDTLAIFLALRSRELDVIGLTTIFGNADGATTAQNALRLVEIAGFPSIPVARGCDSPLVIPLLDIAAHVHGQDGLGNSRLPAPSIHSVPEPAAQFIINKVKEYPGEVTLVPIGPLTNIALACKLEPAIIRLVKEVVLMGGAFSTAGNISPVAEANFYHDPHAADIVLSAGWPVVMVGLDVTHQTVMSPSFLEEIFKGDDPPHRLLRQVLPCYQDFHHQFYGMGGSIHTHDPSAIAYLLAPHLYKTTHVPVFMETYGRCMGQSIADRHEQWGARTEIQVCENVDGQAVLALIRERFVK